MAEQTMTDLFNWRDKYTDMKNSQNHESTDKRVIKTIRNLKNTMLKMMDKKPFEKIGVTELCREACISRITFYTYYQDKYALLQDIYRDMQQEMEEEFLLLQKENNPSEIPEKSYRNFAVAVVHMYGSNSQFFRHLNPLESPEVMKTVYGFAEKHISEFCVKYRDKAGSRYSPGQIAAFLITGFWGFAIYGQEHQVSPEKREKDAVQLFSEIMKCAEL